MNGLSSKNTPLDIYHGVPKGWRKEEILEMHRSLNGVYPIGGGDATEPGAPSWMPDRYSWLQYRETLKRVSDGVRASDSACIEIAIRYIELNYFGSYSGFIRESLARGLKSQELSKSQRERLELHFQRLIAAGMCFQEFKEYKKIRSRILNES